MKVKGWKDIVSNAKVYNFGGAVRASKYPMAIDTNNVTMEIVERTKSLAKCPRGSAHDNFLNGILVAFDLTFTNKGWVEFERYHFADIVSSQSTMHRIAKFDIAEQMNEYVTQNTIDEVNRLKEIYLKTQDKEDYLRLLYNVPSGIKLTAQIVTNYGQLKTMYYQRYNHRLPEWREFCQWISSLPRADEFICNQNKEKYH